MIMIKNCPKGTWTNDNTGSNNCLLPFYHCKDNVLTNTTKGYFSIPVDSDPSTPYLDQCRCDQKIVGVALSQTCGASETQPHAFYCPYASGLNERGIRKIVYDGWYSTPEVLGALRTGVEPCNNAQWYCPRGIGVREATPRGHYSILDPTNNLYVSALPCGSRQYWCADGVRTFVDVGFFTLGGSFDGTTADSTLICPKGSYCMNGEKIPCSPGKYSSSTGASAASTCLPCDRMTYGPSLEAESKTSCLDCPAGRFSRVSAELCWPAIVHAAAIDDGEQPGLGNGDSVEITFQGPTSQPGLNTPVSNVEMFQKILLATVLQGDSVFTVTMGKSFDFQWHNTSFLKVLIVNAQGMGDRADTRAGKLRVDVASFADLQDDGRKSQFATPFGFAPFTYVVLSGSWGAYDPPRVIKVSARSSEDTTRFNDDSWDAPSTAGLNLGDSILIDFNIETNGILNTKITDADVRKLVDFNQAFPKSIVMLEGSWVVGGRRLVVTLVEGNVNALDYEKIRVGALSVSVKADSGIRSRDLSSSTTVPNAPLLDMDYSQAGSFGDGVSDVEAKLMAPEKVQITFCPPSNDSPIENVRTRQDNAWSSIPKSPRQYQLQWRVANSTGSSNVHSRNFFGEKICSVVPCDCKTRLEKNLYETQYIEGLPRDMNIYIRMRVIIDDPAMDGTADLKWGPPVYPSPTFVGTGLAEVDQVYVVGGSQNMATSGGELVRLFGKRFGANSEWPHPPKVTYGPKNDLHRYAAENCSVVVDNQEIQCITTEGVGKHLLWSLEQSNLTVTVKDCCDDLICATCTGYSPPTIFRFVGAGVQPGQVEEISIEIGVESQLASTIGNEDVYIIGDNFGPLGHAHIFSATYNASATGRSYDATGCSVIKAHERIHCLTASGVGGRLDWQLVIGGQASRSPSTGYMLPIITSIVPHSLYDTRGGDIITIQGRNFGYEPVFVRGIMQGDQSSTDDPVKCIMTAIHTELQCVIPEGTGSGKKWSVEVAQQKSVPYSYTASYAAPNVSEILVTCGQRGTGLFSLSECEDNDLWKSAMSTNASHWHLGGVLTNSGVVVLRGKNFGSKVDKIKVVFGDKELQSSSIVLLKPHEMIQIVLPSGEGVGHMLQVDVDGLSSGALHRTIPYGRPSVLSMEIDDYENKQHWGSSKWVQLRIYGINFGSMEGYLQGKLQVYLNVGSGNKESRCVTSTHDTERRLYISATQETIFCNTTSLTGSLTVHVDGVMSSARAYDFNQLMAPPAVVLLKVYDAVESKEYTDLGSLSSFSTSGGEFLRIYAENIYHEKKYRVVLGRKSYRPTPPVGVYLCTKTETCSSTSNTGDLSCRNSAISGSDQLTKAKFLQCTIPPGIGTDLVVVVLELSSSPGQQGARSSSDPNTQSRISYAKPRVGVGVGQVTPNEGPTEGGNIVVIPCENCGSWVTAKVETSLLPSVRIGGVECVVSNLTAWVDGSIECKAPPNVGHQFISVSVGGQDSKGEGAQYSYRAPFISCVNIIGAPFDSICGGATVRIQGHDFGGGNGTDPERSDWGLAFIGKVPCSILSWNNTLVECVSGPGEPGKKQVKIQQASSSGRASSLNLTYSVSSPSILSMAPLHGPTSGGNMFTIRMSSMCSHGIGVNHTVALGDDICELVDVVIDSPSSHISTGTVRCILPSGRGGANIPCVVRVRVGDFVDVEVYSAPSTFSYDPPFIERVRPATGLRTEGGSYLYVEGRNFGPGGPSVSVRAHGVNGVNGYATTCEYVPEVDGSHDDYGHTRYACIVGPGHQNFGIGGVLWATVEGQTSNIMPVSFGKPKLRQFQSSMATVESSVSKVSSAMVDALGERIHFESVLNIPFLALLPIDGNSCRGSEGCADSIVNQSTTFLSVVAFNTTNILPCANIKVKRTWVNTNDGDPRRKVYPTTGKESDVSCDLPSGVVGPVLLRMTTMGVMSLQFTAQRTCRGERVLEGGVVQAGYFGTLGKNCTKCPLNSHCFQGAASPISAPGYWSNRRSDGSYEIMTCVPEKACLKNNTCAVGYQDVRCSKCCNGTRLKQVS